METNILTSNNPSPLLEENKEQTDSVHNEGIDTDFHSWNDRVESSPQQPSEARVTDQTNLQNKTNERMFDENPLLIEEKINNLPTDTLNERETMTKLVMENYKDSNTKIQNRDKRIQSLTRSSASSERKEERISKSLERPGKSSSINQFSSQYQFNRETDPAAFKRYENEVSMSRLPLSLNLEDLIKEESILIEIFSRLQDETDPSTA